MTSELEPYKAALRRVYRLALDGNWKCDRAIRRICEDVLGGRECAIIIAERKAEGEVAGCAN